MIYIVFILIFACANNLFDLVPDTQIQGVFNVRDIGNLLIWVSLAYLLCTSKNLQVIFNSISLLVVLYLFMVSSHISIASFNYDQSIISGIITSRHQFYYLSYFVFLLALDDERKIERFMQILSVLALILILLSVINYMGLTIFHHRWAEGHGARAGITRAYIPAMNIIGMVFIWQLAKYTSQGRVLGYHGLGALVIFGGLLFRQGRMRIIAATLAALWLLFRAGRYKMMAAVVLTCLGITLVLGLVMQKNLVVETFRTAYTDVTQEEGTWAPRVGQIERSMKSFKEHPWIGSGALVLRRTKEMDPESRAATEHQGDLGIPHMLKNFGVLGIVWMVLLVIAFFWKTAIRRRSDRSNIITLFAESQFIQMALSMITLNYLIRPAGILVVCLILALISRQLAPGPAPSQNGTVLQGKPL